LAPPLLAWSGDFLGSLITGLVVARRISDVNRNAPGGYVMYFARVGGFSVLYLHR
jgi:hypothetical protein